MTGSCRWYEVCWSVDQVHETDDQVVAAAEEPRATRLEQLVDDIGGVTRVQVDIRADGSPHIRVWLDGSVSSDDVGAEIQEILASAQTRQEEKEPTPTRRTGLGRGLNELLAANGDTQPLPHFGVIPERETAPEPDVAPERRVAPEPDVAPAESAHLVLVAVEESAGGIAVRVADSNRAVAFSPVEDTRSLNQAVTSAVARLRQHRPTPRLEGVEVRKIAGEPVLSVVLLLEGGQKAAGAEIVRGGLPFTLGRAVWKALAFTE